MKYLLALSILLLPFTPFWAQGFPVEEIGVGQGLPQGFVTSLAQDREGFIWMGTTNCGLARYDGHRFQQYTFDPFNPNSLPGNYIYSVSDLDDYLFVSTLWDGVSLLHKKTGRFFRLPFDPMQEEDVTGMPIRRSMTLDRLPASSASLIQKTTDGAVWIRSHRHPGSVFWLCRMTVPPGFWEQLPSASPSQEAKLRSQLKLECWMLKNAFSGVLNDEKTVLREEAGKLLAWDGQGWQPLSVPGSVVQQIDRKINCPGVPKGEFWMLRNGEIWKSNNQGRAWEKMATAPPGMYVYHFGKDWALARQGNYNYAFPLQYSPFRIDFSKPLWTVEVVDERHHYLLDATENLWYLNQVGGVRKFSPRNARFNTVRTENARFERPFLQTKTGVLAYFRKDKLLHIKGEPSELASFIESAFDRDRMRAGIVKSDGKDLVVVGGRNNLAIIDIAARTSKSYSLPYRDAHPPSEFLIAPGGKLLLPIGGALIHFDTKTEAATSLDFRHVGVAGLQIYAIEKTADGSVWLGTDDGLLRIFPTPGDRIRQDTIFAAGKALLVPVFKANTQLYKTDPNNRASMRSNFTASLLVDPSDPNILWVGTKGGGLQRLHLRTEKFDHITTQNGLNDNVVYGILPDEVGNLWLSTNKGLTRYNPSAATFKHFRKADGLQDDEFNTSSFAKMPDGTLYFGGINGMNIFRPAAISDNPNVPAIRITGLKLNNQAVTVGDSTGVLRTAIEFLDKITLPFSKNNITLEFAALEFTATAKNSYRYWLEGLEDEQDAHIGHEPHATYLSLSPGNYTFVVYGSNNDGVWSKEPARLKIRVLPPWYRTWLAYFVYLALVGGLVAWYFSLKEKRRQLQLDLERQQSALEKHQSEAAHIEAMNRLKLEEFAHRLLEKSQLVEALSKELDELQEEKLRSFDNEGQVLIDLRGQLASSNILTKRDWLNFQSLFDQAYPGYITFLQQTYPNITAAETRLLLLTKMGLTTNESAIILAISPESVKKTRQRLRKKLEENGGSLEELLEA